MVTKYSLIRLNRLADPDLVVCICQCSISLSSLHLYIVQILFQCLADVEAFIDFSEDQDIEETVVNQGN